MSLYSRGEPVSNNQFRENTAKRAVMAGVAKIPGKTLCVLRKAQDNRDREGHREGLCLPWVREGCSH